MKLKNTGCKPGNLNLIALTHGDFVHAGIAAYLRDAFDTEIAIHDEDSGMVEHGCMFWNRNKPNILIRKLLSSLSKFGKSQCFKPDIFLEDGEDLRQFRVKGMVFEIPGHSLGSIGILMGNGNFYCGDLFENTKKPGLNSLMDDLAAAKASVEKLKSLEINTVFPGHGKPFDFKQLSNETAD